STFCTALCHTSSFSILFSFVSFSFPSISSLFFFFFLIIRRPPSSTLFPYTTLVPISFDRAGTNRGYFTNGTYAAGLVGSVSAVRSEEHTSELQSRSDLVCRLLLEKKKKKKK